MTIAPQTQAISNALGPIPSALIHNLLADARAFARANGYYNDFDVRNAIEHAYTSANWAYSYGRGTATLLGDLKELTSDQPLDSSRDQWNNEVGRRMAEYARENGYPREVIDRLMLEAIQNGELITDLNDPRINSQPPQTPPCRFLLLSRTNREPGRSLS